MTWINEISPEEKNCIEELKKRTIKDVTPKMLEDPHLFYRFSKARDFNLKLAESMLRKHIAWRKEYNADTILTDYETPEVLTKYAPSSFIGYDKDGNPIRYISVPGSDTKGILKSAKRIDLLKYNLQLIEQDVELLRLQSQKLEKPVTNVVYIYNFDGMTFSKATHKESIELMMLAIKMYQDNYPERIKAIYVINASIYFSMLFSVVKVIVATAVLEKIHFFGAEGWKEDLLKIIDADVLPAFLGGDRTDANGDPLCNSFVVHGGTVPEHYYLQKSKRTLHQEPGVKKLNVTRFSSSNVTFDVPEPGSFLEWEFETKDRDIGFGVYFKDLAWTESKLEELIPKQRFDTCYEPETGMYKCEKAGTYIIMFDNSYSWIYPKEIYYRASVLPPSELECE